MLPNSGTAGGRHKDTTNSRGFRNQNGLGLIESDTVATGPVEEVGGDALSRGEKKETGIDVLPV